MTEYKLRYKGKYQNKGVSLPRVSWMVGWDVHRETCSIDQSLRKYFKSDSGKTYTKKLFGDPRLSGRLENFMNHGVEIVEINMCDKGCKIKVFSKEEVMAMIKK